MMNSDSSKSPYTLRSLKSRRPLIHSNCRLYCLLVVLVFLIFVISCKTLISDSVNRLPIPQNLSPNQRFCAEGYREKFMWYAPHSGFGNQLSEFKNAVVIAGILNRTLIVPPILDHHAVALGSCPKFRVVDPNDLRFKVWNHSIELLREGRYVSMADIMDLSSLVSSSTIRFIDFRVFISMYCGVYLNSVCSSSPDKNSAFLLQKCGTFLSGYDGIVENCLFASQDDCRTTVWTYRTGAGEDLFQASDEVKKKRKISYMRYRKDIYETLGPSSAAGSATILAFGSLFTAPYGGSESHIDIHRAPEDQGINELIQSLISLPFASEILQSGKEFAHRTINAPFLCLQLRLMDGQFKNHWTTTFQYMKKELDMLKQNSSLPINLFVMTDLPIRNWTGTLLGTLSKDPSFKVFFLSAGDKFVSETGKKIVDRRHSLKPESSFSGNFNLKEQQCGFSSIPDVLLYLEQSICSCGSLGFIGTSGSTIAEAIELMRRNRMCS